MKTCLLAVAFLLCFAPTLALAQDTEDPSHGELRAVRDDMVDAINKNDVDRLLSHLHKNVVVTWMNGEVSRGHDGVRAYYQKMMTAPGHLVATYSTTVEVDELTVLYGGDSGIAFGKSADKFKLTNGSDFAVNGRWTADLVKEDGKWVIAAFHTSANMFDNPVLDTVQRYMYRVAGVALAFGLGIGALVGFLLGRRKRAA